MRGLAKCPLKKEERGKCVLVNLCGPFKLNFVAALDLSYFWLQLANQVLCYWKE